MTGGGENAFSRGVTASLGGRAGSVQKGVTHYPAGEAPVGIEPTNRGFADLFLTTWLRRQRVKSHQNTQVSQPRRASSQCESRSAARPLGAGGFRNKWDFASTAVFWQDKNRGDAWTANLSGKRFEFLVENEMWYKTRSAISIGPEIRVSYNARITRPNPASVPALALAC